MSDASEPRNGEPLAAGERDGRTSRSRYDKFREDFQRGRLDEAIEEAKHGKKPDDEERSPEERKAKRRRHMRAYTAWIWPHRYSVVMLFVLALIAAALEMTEPLFMRFIIDHVLLVDDLETPQRFTRLHVAGGLFLTVIIVSRMIGVGKDYYQRLLNSRVMLSLRRSLFDRLLHLPLPNLWEMKTGGILSRLSGDVDTTTGLLQMAIVSPTVSVIRLLIALGVLVSLNWRLAVTALAVIPGVMAVSYISVRRIRPIYRSLRKDVEELDGRAGETFSGIRVVRAFRREVRELLDYLVSRHTVLRKSLFAHRRELVIWTSWAMLLGGVNVVIVWYGGYLNLTGAASIGDIMAFQWYTFLLLNPVWQIVNTFSELQRSLAAMERVFDVLAMDPDKPDRPDAIDAPPTVHELRFEHVDFEYHEGRPVVIDFDVTVAGASVVALVGRSGAGKTTATDLVARFHDPTRGRILLNGVDLRDLKLDSYRDLLAVVQQDVFLFDGTVRDNIAFGRRNAADAEVEQAAHLANAHEFIVGLPGGYEAMIGERGVEALRRPVPAIGDRPGVSRGAANPDSG